MKQALRDYQQNMYDLLRAALATKRKVFVQIPTGGGKTVIDAAICESIFKRGKKVWVIVPRNELVEQMSRHLTKWGVPHGRITAKSNESRAYNVHVVSKDTLIRRYDKIKNWPDAVIFDEAHLYFDRQIEIVSHLPEKCIIIGQSATPERLDGRGLDELYEGLIEGPSIPWLTEGEYLTPLRYFSPPLEGLADLKYKGNDVDEEQLEELLNRKKVYGQVVNHYTKYGKGKAALIFCRSIKSAEHTAEQFQAQGYKFYNIDGTMSDGKRKGLIDQLTRGEIDGLCGCEIFTYGLDIPRVEYGASIRPTLSRSLYMQMIGRILRPFKDEKTGYEKQDAVFMDHVNLLLEHYDPDYPGVPLHYIPHIKWNFSGKEKRKRIKSKVNPVLCPHLDFMYCPNPKCATCEHNPDHTVKDARKPMLIIPAELVEAKKPVPISELPYTERREIQDKIGSLVLDYQNTSSAGAIAELLKIADAHGYPVMWVYHRLTEETKNAINVPLIYEIARQKKYNNGWCYYKIKELKKKNRS